MALLPDKLRSIASWLRSSETLTGLILAVTVGVIAGLGAVAFRWLIGTFQYLFFDGGSQLLSGLGEYYIILVPAAGGLLVGPLIYYFAREAKGHGVPEVMEAVALRGGQIRPRVSVVKAFALSVSIEGEDPQEFYRDKALPESRGCPESYRLADVIAPAEGKQGKAVVLIHKLTFGFEGRDARFLAVPVELPGAR